MRSQETDREMRARGYLTVAEAVKTPAAKKAGLTELKLYRLLRAAEAGGHGVAGCKVGRRFRYVLASDLDAYHRRVTEETRKAQEVAARAEATMSAHGYIPVREATKLARLDESTIYRWIRDGLVKSRTAETGLLYVKRDEVNALLGPLAQPRRTA